MVEKLIRLDWLPSRVCLWFEHECMHVGYACIYKLSDILCLYCRFFKANVLMKYSRTLFYFQPF